MEKMKFDEVQNLGSALTPEEMKAMQVGSSSGICTCILHLYSGQFFETSPVSSVSDQSGCDRECNAICERNKYCESVSASYEEPTPSSGSCSCSGSGSGSGSSSGPSSLPDGWF